MDEKLKLIDFLAETAADGMNYGHDVDSMMCKVQDWLKVLDPAKELKKLDDLLKTRILFFYHQRERSNKMLIKLDTVEFVYLKAIIS